MPMLNKAQAKKQKVLAAKSTSTYTGNGKPVPAVEESGFEVQNNMSVDTLIDPEDYEAGGSTHFSNSDASHSVLASKKRKAKLRANDMDGGSDLDPDTTNVGTIPNDIDPAQGVLADFDGDDEDEDEADPFGGDLNSEVEDDPDDMDFDGDDDTEVDADTTVLDNDIDPSLGNGNDATLQNNMGVTELEVNAGEGDDEDWDAPPVTTDEDLAEDDLADMEDQEDGTEVEQDLETVVEPEDVIGADAVSVLDIDETDDGAVDDVAFAAAGTRLMCIKANRIIATMTGRMAVASGRNDQYLTDQFQQVTAMQIKEKGLRKGLKSMGFALATVSLAKQSVLKAQVQKEVTKTTAAVRKVNADKEKAFAQSLAIASIGINRKMFKDAENPLRAHLEGEFRRMGIQGGGRLLAHAFAEYGPAYAKQVVQLAHKISAMPEEVRDGYVDMMDMGSGVMDEPEEDMVPIGAEDGDEDEFDEEDFGQSVEATLARPGTKIKAHAAASGKYSVEANQILAGQRPLFVL